MWRENKNTEEIPLIHYDWIWLLMAQQAKVFSPTDHVFFCKFLWNKRNNSLNVNYRHRVEKPFCAVLKGWSHCCLKRLVSPPFSPNRMAAQRWCYLYRNDNNPNTLPRWDVRVHLHPHHAINQYLEMVWEQFRDWAGRANPVWMMTVCSLSQIRASPLGIRQNPGSRLCGLKRQTGCQRSAFLAR